MHRGGYERVLEDTRRVEKFAEHDRTLILNFRAQAKLALGYQDSAREDFLRAWNIMNDGAGDTIASYTPREDRKHYVGDPYERVFASHYLGLMYYMLGQPDEALLCFDNALAVDTGDLELNEYAADFVPAMLMRARVFLEREADGDARDALARIAALPRERRNFDPDFPWFSLESQADANALFFVELGDGPFFTAEGRHGRIRTLNAAAYPEAFAEIWVDGQPLGRTYKVADTFFQAATRGGRPMDEVLKRRSRARTALTVTGAVGMGVGASLMRHGYVGSGAVTLGAGFALLLSGLFIHPRADVRCNLLLPGEVHLFMAKFPPGEHEIELRVYDKDGRELPEMRQPGLIVNIPQRGDAVTLLRSQPRYKIPDASDRLADPYARHEKVR